MSTLTVQPAAKDTSLEEADPTGNYGSSQTIGIQSRDAGRNRRSIIEFDISSLPAGVTLQSATLSLYLSFILNSAGRTYWAYKLTRTDWVENQATWNRYKTSNNWTAPGGDFVTSSPSGGSAIVPSSAGDWLNFNILAIVQDALDRSINVEVLLKDGTESQNSTSRYCNFYSSENAQTTLRPKLVIVYSYTVPTITIQAISNIVTTTARGHGNVTSLGDATINQHGHCWAIGSEPTTSDSKTELGSKATVGTFVSVLTGLTVGQTYRVRAYITDGVGTVYYSGELSFVAGTAGAQSYPIDAQTRVTALIHRYDRGTYTLEVLLGEVTADFGLPPWSSKPQSSLPFVPDISITIPGATNEAMIKSLQDQIDRLMDAATRAGVSEGELRMLLDEINRLEVQKTLLG